METVLERSSIAFKLCYGWGIKSCSEAIRLKGHLSGAGVFYALEDCPAALSLGEQVNVHKKAWIWMPDELPYFAKPARVQDMTLFVPESAKVYADPVVENVPILSEKS